MSSMPDDKWGDDVAATPYTETGDQEVAETPSGGTQLVKWATIRSVVGEVVETVVLTLVIFFLIQTVVRNFRVVGTSMEPNLHNSQYLIIDKLSYRFGHPHRGDVVVFEPPTRPGEDYVKRVISLPGELVEIRRGQVFVNGQLLGEPYTVRPGSYSMEARRVGAEELFVLGDNRNSSSDSHTWGMLPVSKVVGRAWVSYWPPSQWGAIRRDIPTETSTLSYWVDNVFQ